ncbi:hypothetical protein CAEBREN_05024 [Caenorhabditis brenneri]|uniref:Uncharacterized protein n=1 Tax=Caenorhabditis brenneri TaxID=135651 RepID=G0MMF7_CAEBE|nr:hypothetical protein CAEBREN_05024 [Caenorhabditis brenneri]
MDPNNSRSMSYDSLKILLQYAKANLRFELSRRIPSMRLMEKLVPLRIDKLSIGSHGVEVNGLNYEVRLKRHFTSDDIDLRGFLFDYTSPDGEWDLDEWGFDDYSSENTITPGDLVLQVEGYGPRQGDRSEQRMNAIENHLRFIEWMVAKKSEEIVRLIRNWIENPQEVGKSLSFEGGEWSVMNTMEQIQSLFIGVKRKRWIRIPVNNFSKISVSYDTEVLWRENSKFRLMTIEVVAV